MFQIIKMNTTVAIKHVLITKDATIGSVSRTINSLIEQVLPGDVVCCPWVMPGNDSVDQSFIDLVEMGKVVVSLGDSNQCADELTPTRVPGVIIVGALNKSGIPIKRSNHTETPVKWVSGTNYRVGTRNESGSSVSAAIYASFLAEAMKLGNTSLVNGFIEAFNQKVRSENDKYNIIKEVMYEPDNKEVFP